MKLYEHPEFEQAILAAETHFSAQGLRAPIIEKDYYVTEVLRVIAHIYPEQVIFKGGTSLSKGWNLINHIDLFLDPQAFEPTLSKRGIDRELKQLRDVISSHPALTFMPDESKTVGGFGRSDRFQYEQLFAETGDVSGTVLLEVGTASGREPTTTIALRSLVAQFLSETNRTLHAEDEHSFEFRLLHFRRTFVEKLFAIHGKVERFKQERQGIGTQARHYYDLYQLSNTPEVLQMLNSPEYGKIKEDYDKISQASFGKYYLAPEGLRFTNSDALFPPNELASLLQQEYEQQCELLCYGNYPAWDVVLEKFVSLRPLL